METSTRYHQENQTWSIDWTPFQSKSYNLFCTVDKLILNLCRETKVPEKNKSTLKVKNKVGGLTLLDYKTYYKTILNQECRIGKRYDKGIGRKE